MENAFLLGLLGVTSIFLPILGNTVVFLGHTGKYLYKGKTGYVMEYIPAHVYILAYTTYIQYTTPYRTTSRSSLVFD